MDGSLDAESSGIAGEGATFHLVVRADESPDIVPATARPAPDLRGCRVLVVDDNDTNRRIVRAHVGRWEMTTADTASPLEALGWVRAGEEFDLAILDMHMPELDGVELAEAMRDASREAGREPAPVLILSSVGTRERRSDAVAAELTKPVKPSALLDAVLNVLAPDVTGSAPRPAPIAASGAGLGETHPLRILLAEDNAVNVKPRRGSSSGWATPPPSRATASRCSTTWNASHAISCSWTSRCRRWTGSRRRGGFAPNGPTGRCRSWR